MHKGFFLLFFVLLGSGCQIQPIADSVDNEITSVQIGNATYSVEVKDTPIERNQGLSGREKLGENEGMLFLFDQPQELSFWMKDMQFPLDFIWINDQVVIGLDEHIPHPAINNNEIARLSSPEATDTVLEVNAGHIELYGLKIGDLVKYER